MSTQMKESEDRWIFRGTNRRKGRHVAITPQNSQMQHLVYGRIILDAGEPRAAFSTGELETGLICLSGECTIKAAGETHRIGRYDSIYIPRDTDVEVTTETAVDLVECSAEVDGKYPLQVVRYAVVMPRGFHPNVSVPGHTISFVWMMAAHREVEDRQFGVVNVQPGFDAGGSGLEASRK